MNKIAVRVYTEQKKTSYKKEDITLTHSRILVFDTETTNDKYQNFKFGSFRIYNGKFLEHIGIFYNSKCVDSKELEILEKYCKKNGIELYKLKEFIEDIFLPQLYQLKTLCVGFNLPFDISRLCIKHSYCRGSMNGGFSFQLSQNKKFPRIKIKHLDSTKSFIKFGKSLYGNFRGYFLDLKTLAVTLTDDKHITLRKACETFKTKRKKLTDISHGIVTEKYIEYNLIDVLATYELYLKMKEELERYEIKIPITEVYSSASLGKACLKQLGVKSFLKANPYFPKKILGYLMSAYYGGRSEVKIRKIPTKVTVIDFLSMYPTMFIMIGSWDLLIADRIKCVDYTNNARKLVEEIKLEGLRKPKMWKKLNAIVQTIPDKDILPARKRYGNDDTFNIGINYISGKPIWYTLPDIIASKILTGKSPKILKAIRFIPEGKQNLNKTQILGMKIDPNEENLFKRLIEERNRLKECKEDFRQKALKIVANATSYGIFVEINSRYKKSKVKIYSNDEFVSEVKKIEYTGKHFNPIIAVMITSGARLVLAIAETLLKKHNRVHAFCDTDSMAVPPKYVKEIQDFFNPLNPYSFDKPLFKEEKKNVLFYGISAKRYVLYQKKDEKFIIKDHSLHGLGHLTNPFSGDKDWHKMVWEDILRLHYGMISKSQFLNKYSDLFAISQMSISTFGLMKIFKKLNRGKPYGKQIKPFNFFLIGVGNQSNIKPINNYSDNPQEIVYKKFVDYTTGRILKGSEYWKSLSDILWEYLNHKESKLKGDVGILERKHVNVDSFIHIGKETKNIERVGILDSPDYSIYGSEEELKAKIMKLTSKDARVIGLNEETLRCIKKRIQERKPLRLYRKTEKMLMEKDF